MRQWKGKLVWFLLFSSCIQRHYSFRKANEPKCIASTALTIKFLVRRMTCIMKGKVVLYRSHSFIGDHAAIPALIKDYDDEVWKSQRSESLQLCTTRRFLRPLLCQSVCKQCIKLCGKLLPLHSFFVSACSNKQTPTCSCSHAFQPWSGFKGGSEATILFFRDGYFIGSL